MYNGCRTPTGFTASVPSTPCPLFTILYVPATYFLNEVKQLPADLENYVLKTTVLFCRPGSGDRRNACWYWKNKRSAEPDIKKRKAQYADIIETHDIAAKAELRIMYALEERLATPATHH